VQIIPVAENDGLEEFIDVQRSFYRDDPHWIPPMREPVTLELSGRSAFSRYGRMQLFVCRAEGCVAGRIASLINPRLRNARGEALGQIGYFECVDDQGIAAALMNAGMAWLRDQGIRELLGPMNGGAHRTHRLLTRGFDRTPFLFEPRNPEYYPRLFDGCGMVPVSRWSSYDLDRERAAALHHRFEAVLARRPAPVTIEELDPKRAMETIERIYRLLDGVWAGHTGYASLDLDEFTEVFAGALTLMTPRNISVLVRNLRDEGLAFTYPDYSAEVRALGGSSAGWGRWLGNGLPRRIVLSTAALLPELRKTSAAMAQMNWALRRSLEDGYDEPVIALAVEGFLGKIGERTREYTLYWRSLA
jgi:hypothetical protein